MQNQIVDSNMTSEFNGSDRLRILALKSCVTLNLLLNLIVPLFSHITLTVVFQVVVRPLGDQVSHPLPHPCHQALFRSSGPP